LGFLVGLEVMLSRGLHKDERLGLITNHSGLDSNLNQNLDLLQEKGYQVGCLFGPEHGLYGDHPDGLAVPSRQHGELRVYSLYGERTAPSPESLEGLDRLVFDIQDIGCRYYTYMSTMLLSMEAAAKSGIPFTVLDRPNPLGGIAVEGNLPAEGHLSFVCGAKVAIRHGMTLGEIARMAASETGVPEPEVIRMEGWRRPMYFEETGHPWVPTSPAASSMEMAFLYPGTCLIEGTNVSEGRGTATPFTTIGAPWIDGRKLASALRRLELPGVLVRPTFFTPLSQKYTGVQCQGVQFHVVNRHNLAPVELGVKLLFVLRDTFDEFQVRERPPGSHYSLDWLCGGPGLREALVRDPSPDPLLSTWIKEAKEFEARRQGYLLYS
jgi:uncharacterized protein YbbC (DUF1343 family)